MQSMKVATSKCMQIYEGNEETLSRYREGPWIRATSRELARMSNTRRWWRERRRRRRPLWLWRL
jgi:hypothetical protein